MKFICRFFFLVFSFSTFSGVAKSEELKKTRVGISVGNTQLLATNGDRFYTLDYKANVFVWGADFSQETTDAIISVSSLISNYKVREQPRQTSISKLTYLFRFKPKFRHSEFLIGPLLEAFSFPRELTTDGINIDSESITQYGPGFTFVLKLLTSRNSFWTLQGSSYFPLIASTTSAPADPKNICYSVQTGFAFGPFKQPFKQPFRQSFKYVTYAADVQYRFDTSSTLNSLETTKTQIKSYTLKANVSYEF
ncbi:MAG: hypothetical protein H7235_02290 [Bdellovibrionaceae bacterium]|nr:hypothetical protein [Pseudobdellovibrionaceae bacterium]